MLQGLLIGASIFLCYGLLFLAYGKQGMQIRQELGLKITIPLFLILFISILYALLIGLWNMEANHDWYEYAFLIGAPVAYILFVIYARLWSRHYGKLLKEEREAELREQQNKENEELQKQQQKEAQQASLEARISTAKKAFADDSSLACFLEKAAECQKYSEILELWDSLNPAPNDWNTLIRQEIASAVSVERMYGPNPKRIPAFLTKLQNTYGTAVIETIPIPEVVEEK